MSDSSAVIEQLLCLSGKWIEHNFKKQLGFQETSKQAGSNTQEVEEKLNQGGHWPCEGASCLGWWL